MSKLKELIDQLYEEVTQQNDEVISEDGAIDSIFFSDIDPERLRGSLLQMGELLHIEDMAGMHVATPLVIDEAIRLILEWEGICNSIEGLKRHMRELDADIVRMQPWGDFDVVKLEQLSQHDCHIRFWTLPVDIFATQVTEPWYIDHQATLVSQDAANAYFITISVGNEIPQMPVLAQSVEICPCPVSTLIMLQTRDKDSLKRLKTKQGDFALAHYTELRETLRTLLPDGAELPTKHFSHRQILKLKLKKIFRKA